MDPTKLHFTWNWIQAFSRTIFSFGRRLSSRIYTSTCKWWSSTTTSSFSSRPRSRSRKEKPTTFGMSSRRPIGWDGQETVTRSPRVLSEMHTLRSSRTPSPSILPSWESTTYPRKSSANLWNISSCQLRSWILTVKTPLPFKFTSVNTEQFINHQKDRPKDADLAAKKSIFSG